MSYSRQVDNIETFESVEDLRAARHQAHTVVKLQTTRPRGMVDPELPDEWKDRPVIRASESPALKARREAEQARQRMYAKRRGPESLAEFDRKVQDEAASKAERERIEATAREALEEEAETGKIERAKARLRREAEASPV
jgi:hypothetical protein